jgi:tetratricopeptide (TPR) repeat protein
MALSGVRSSYTESGWRAVLADAGNRRTRRPPPVRYDARAGLPFIRDARAMSHDVAAMPVTPPLSFVVRTARRLVLGLALAAMLGGGPAREAAAQWVTPQAPKPLAGVERLREWLTAIERHEPGELDEPALAISFWSRFELNAAMADLRALLDRASGVVSRIQRTGGETVINTGSGPLTLADARDLLGLTDDEIRRRDPTRIVKRGAVLHIDVAVFTSFGLVADHSRGYQKLLVNDGQRVGSDTSSYHWEFGRALLDSVKPDPGGDEMVRLWYAASAAFMVSRADLAELQRHVGRARRLLPTDAAAQFFSGVLHENFASPQIQSAILGTKTEIGSVESESKEAEKLFRQAVTLEPAFVEARLRLGRTLGVVGRHAEAAVELQRAIAATDDRLLQYYGNMCLGREEQALGRREEARAAFERAASLYPRAQSSYLALSQLARRYGDKAGARGALRPVLDLPARGSEREDPWWDYYISAGRHADALLTELRRPFLADVKR